MNALQIAGKPTIKREAICGLVPSIASLRTRTQRAMPGAGGASSRAGRSRGSGLAGGGAAGWAQRGDRRGQRPGMDSQGKPLKTKGVCFGTDVFVYLFTKLTCSLT